MTLAVDVRVLGIPELERSMRRLEARTQKKIVRKALRNSAKRAKPRILENIAGRVLTIRSGTLFRAFVNAKIRAAGSRGLIRIGVEWPTRAELGIDPGDRHFYPAAVEYGHGNVPPHPFLRPAIDNHRAAEILLIGRDIGREIEREASKS